jgi:hypothetical protein
MESSYLVVFSVVAGSLFLLVTIVSLIYWARVAALEDEIGKLTFDVQEKAQPKQIEKALQVAESSADRIDNALLQLQKFREGVHGEMQRFYAIMRRNEKALGSTYGKQEEDSTDEPPDEIDPKQLKSAKDPDPRQVSKADLRAIAREKGIQI